MKKLFICVLAIAILASPVFAQQYVEDINKAMRNGDVEVISKYFDSVVDISIAEESSTYSKSQGQMVIKNFLTKNESTRFRMTNSGGESGHIYLIGRLDTKSGNYTVFFFLKQKNKNATPYLQEIKIERQ